MEISKSVSNELSNLNNNRIASKQNNFLQSTTWKVIDKGLDIGIRSLLPNIIEDQVIEIKNAIINNGFKSGVKQAVNSAIDLGKSTAGIFTGKFESVSQARNVIKDGGIIDTISDTLNFAINKAVEKNAISSDTGKVIIRGKNAILNTIETNIENNYTYQLNSIEKLNKYTENWNRYYQNHDFNGMQKEYKKIKTVLPDILPIENTIKEVRKLENVHLLIKNNGKNFALTNEQLQLANELAAVV